MKKAPPCHDLLVLSSADWATSSLKFPSFADKQRPSGPAERSEGEKLRRGGNFHLLEIHSSHNTPACRSLQSNYSKSKAKKQLNRPLVVGCLQYLSTSVIQNKTWDEIWGGLKNEASNTSARNLLSNTEYRGTDCYVTEILFWGERGVFFFYLGRTFPGSR